MSQEPVNITTFPFGQPFVLVSDPFKIVHFRLCYPYKPPRPSMVLTHIPIYEDEDEPPHFVPVWVDGDTLVVSHAPTDDNVAIHRQM